MLVRLVAQRVGVHVGDLVKAGQILGEMDPVDLDDRVRSQESGLKRAEAALREAAARQSYAETQARRYEELLAKAFIRTTVVRAWLDFGAGLMVVDAASETKVDNLIGTLIRNFDEMPKLRRWRTKGVPASHFTSWVQSGEAPDFFTIDDRALLTNPEGGKIRLTNQSMVDDEVRRLVEHGRTCSELAVTHADKLSFVLTQSLVLKRIAHIGVNEERDPAQADMMEEERHDAREHVLLRRARPEVLQEEDRREHTADQDDEHDGVLGLHPRVHLLEAVDDRRAGDLGAEQLRRFLAGQLRGFFWGCFGEYCSHRF